MTAQCAPYICALKFSRLPDYAHGYFSKIFSWTLVVIDPMNVCTKFKVRSFTRSWGTQKIWAILDSLDMPTLSFLQNF